MKNVRVASKRMTLGFKGIISRREENTLGWEYSPAAFNFAFEKGALTGGIGIEKARGYLPDTGVTRLEYDPLPEGVYAKAVFMYQRRTNGQYDDRLVVQTPAGDLYYTTVFKYAGWTKIEGYTLTGDATAVNYNYDGKDVLIMSSAECSLAILDGDTVTSVPNAPRFSSLTVHYERVYGCHNGSKNQVWFSDDFDPSNWTASSEAGGFINFADECGDAIAVVSFLNYLYVFREHGIFRLTAYGDQNEFSIKKLFIGAERIYKHTIALCGDRIMFLADDGMHAFDGYSVSDSVPELPPITFKQNAVGTYQGRHYYLACSIDIGELKQGSYYNNTLLRYDLDDGTMETLSGYDIVSVNPCKSHNADDLIVSTGDLRYASTLGMVSDCGKFFDTNTKKIYRGPYGDLGSGRPKVVRDVTVYTAHSLDVVLVADGKRYTRHLKGKDAPQTVFFGRGGLKIGLELRTEYYAALVTPLSVNVDFL